MKVVITGAGGFVGRALVARLRTGGCDVVAVSRRPGPGIDVAMDLRGPADWRSVAEGSSAFVHLAAIAHAHPPHQPSEAEYRKVNSDPLASICAALRGSRTRLVFMSSVAAICSSSREVVDDRTPPAPSTPYGRTKLDAERLIRDALANDVADWTAIRPPLVYGPGHKGSMLALETWMRAGIPVPTGPRSVRRSFLYVGNLVDAVECVIRDPRASRRTFLVADGEALGVPEVVARIAHARGTRGLTVPVPRLLLNVTSSLSEGLAAVGVGRALRLHEIARRLGEPLEIDDAGFREATGWRPPVDGPTAFARTFSAPMRD